MDAKGHGEHDVKVVILGAAGMLGHKMFQMIRKAFPNTLAIVREDVKQPPFDKVALLQGKDIIPGIDATDFNRLQELLGEIRPNYIVNCVGIIKQRDAAHQTIPNITINSLLPHKLAAFAEGWGGKVIHFSTDCVFSGKRGGYTEEDLSDAEDLYGKSKFLGEVQCDNALTLRTSIIGRELVEHRSLLDWFLSQKGRTIKGFKRVIYSGVTTNQLAEVVLLIIRQFPHLSGLYQVVSEPISKYDLLRLLKDAYKLDVEILADAMEVSDRSMKGDKFRSATGYVCPDWPELVQVLAQDPTPYDQWLA
ncbi:MAG: dTDP-4-dehydrorhamnose reductase family protein [Syntrophobacteraceae bacterium]